MNNNLLKLSVLGFLGVCVLSSGVEGMTKDSISAMKSRNEVIKNYKEIAAFRNDPKNKTAWEGIDELKRDWINKVLARCADANDSYGKAPVKKTGPNGDVIEVDVLEKIENNRITENELLSVLDRMYSGATFKRPLASGLQCFARETGKKTRNGSAIVDTSALGASLIVACSGRDVLIDFISGAASCEKSDGSVVTLGLENEVKSCIAKVCKLN